MQVNDPGLSQGDGAVSITTIILPASGIGIVPRAAKTGHPLAEGMAGRPDLDQAAPC